jgi:penicillin amidase
MKTLKQILGFVGIFILALAILLGGVVGYTLTRSFPQTNGALKIPGLIGKVDVYRDGYGIPHIYADNTHDLFLAQGYVHAQDRFYQMDFWRHQTAGRLSELYGEGTLDADKFLRTVGWRRIAEQEYSLANAETRAILDAYAAGVNAYIASRSAADLSLEYAILGLTGLSDYTPEPWTPPDTLAWAKAMAFNLGDNLDGEIERAILLQKIGVEKTSDYLPTAFPSGHPIILPSPPVGDLERVRTQIASVYDLMGGKFGGIGSNNWVIAGSRTTTGMPLLANDPHLGIQMPAIWYEVGLHCRRSPSGDGALTASCPVDVTGFSFAGAPGVILGHNHRIAWGMTNVGPDVQDLYLEKINPADPNQYEVNGQWVDMTLLTEKIKIKGGGEETVAIRYTRHGPLITSVYGLDEFAGQAGLDPSAQYEYALRWTALDVGYTFTAIFKINKAQNFQEFRDALRDFDAPSQNFVYADVDGNIGYQVPGRVPIRAQGDGLLPAPGWTDEYEWTGYIPFDELPYAYNPPQGYIVTANNAVVGPDYPHLISLSWDAGYRAQRLVDLIEAQPKISIEYIQQMQGDDMNLGAKEVLPHLLSALDGFQFGSPGQARAADALSNWDYQMRMGSQPAAIYMSFFNALLADTFHDDLPETYWPEGNSRTWLTLRNLLVKPDSSWWDNAATPAVETRDDILRQAFVEGYADLEKRLGPDEETWKWGGLHTAAFENATVGSAASPGPIRALFNRGPYPASGWGAVVNNTGGNLARDDYETPGDPYAVRTTPSMRMIVDLGNLDNSLAVFTTGQSGHALHPHYNDLIDMWRLIQYHPMLWSADRVIQNAEAHLVLAP